MGKGKSGEWEAIRIHRLHGGAGGLPAGYRILVDADWPRGVGGNGVPVDDWMPELGPTEWLTTMFGGDPARWGTFRSRYLRQLRSQGRRRRLTDIAGIAGRRPVTLVTAASHERCNPAEVIRELLLREIGRSRRP